MKMDLLQKSRASECTYTLTHIRTHTHARTNIKGCLCVCQVHSLVVFGVQPADSVCAVRNLNFLGRSRASECTYTLTLTLTHTSPHTHIHKRHLSAAIMGRSGKSSAKKRRMLETSNAGLLCMVYLDIVHHTWLCLCHVPFAVGAFVFPAADG